MGSVITHLHLDEALAHIRILCVDCNVVVFLTMVSLGISCIQGQLLDCFHVNTSLHFR